MALGYCPALLLHMKYVIGENAPEHKITPSGFLAAALAKGVQAKPIGDPFQLANSRGHIKDLRLKYYTRTTADQMDTSDNCDVNGIPAYTEMTIDTTSVVKYAFHIDDYTIARYCDEASTSIGKGGVPTDFMQEHLAALMASMPGFIAKIDQVLLASVVWGVNQATSANTATAVNFNDDTTVNLFSEGFTKLLTQYRQNEGLGTPIVVGNGIIDSAMLQAGIPEMTRYSPLNNSPAANKFDYFYDLNSVTSWGANQFGLFMPGTFGLVQLDEYVGFRAGPKGTSTFFNQPIPFAMAGSPELGMLNVDFQFKYIDCPEDTTVQYEDVTLNRGWNLIFKKSFALWQQPSNAYQSGDRLTGNNGALRYTATNS